MPVAAPYAGAVSEPSRVRNLAPGRLHLLGGLTSLLAVVGLAVTYYVFVLTVGGQRVDETAFYGSNLGRTRLWSLAHSVLEVVSVGFVVAVLVATVAIALVRRRWLLTLQVAVVLAGANLCTQVLKKFLLARPDLGISGELGIPAVNTLPSGHTTVAAAATIAVVLVVPRRLRAGVALLGALYVALTGVSTLVGGWHRPSDVVAGLLVTLAVAGLAIALIPEVEPMWRSPSAATRTGRLSPAERTVVAVLTLGTVGAGAVAATALARTWSRVGSNPAFDDIATRADLGRRALLTAYGGGALGVVAVTCAVFAVLVVLLPRTRR